MHDIKNIILSRISDLTSLPKQIDNTLTVIDSETLRNRQILKTISDAKKIQKARQLREYQLLLGLNSTNLKNKQCQEEVLCKYMQLFSASAQICEHYDPTYKEFRKISGGLLSIEEKIRKIYSSFFKEHASHMNTRHLLRAFDEKFFSRSPATFLGWLSEWSRFSFLEMVHSLTTEEHIRFSECYRNNRTELIMGLHESPKKNPLSISTKQVVQAPVVLTLTNKQSIYSYFLDDLNCLYKTFPYELDSNFLKSIKKQGKKEDILREQNLNEAVKILIESKNKTIKRQMNDYAFAYFSKFPGKNKKVGKNDQYKRNKPNSPNKSQKIENSKKIKQFRIKSEALEEFCNQEIELKVQYSQNSLLLSPKSNQISFESSNKLMEKKANQKMKRKLFQLPELIHGNKSLIKSSKSVFSKKKTQPGQQMNPQLKKRLQALPPSAFANLLLKCFTLNSRKQQSQLQIHQPSIRQQLFKNNSYLISAEPSEKDIDKFRIQNGWKWQLEIQKRKEENAFIKRQDIIYMNAKVQCKQRKQEDSFRHNRKLMLQLLRGNNKLNLD